MAASLAHEIRNPLLAIKGAAQLLRQVVGDEDRSLAELIVAEVGRIDQLVATLDPLSPSPSQEAVALNIHEVTEYVRLAARSFAGGVTFVTEYDPSLPPVRGMREALIQVVMNLVKNAAEALAPPLGGEATRLSEQCELSRSGEGAASLAPSTESPLTQPSPPKRGEGFIPTITITTRYLIGERMQRADGGKLPIAISIADNGAGVAEGIIPRLFTPFTTDKVQGKGLGLAIAAKIVEDHAGLIAHDVPPGGGARFTVYLAAA